MKYENPPKGYGTLKVEKIGPRFYRVLEDFVNPYQVVPAGFEFDGASVPRALWTFLSPAGEAFEASCVHDYFYTTHLKTKKYADNAFYEMLRAYGVDNVRATAARKAVEKFGQESYDE